MWCLNRSLITLLKTLRPSKSKLHFFLAILYPVCDSIIVLYLRSRVRLGCSYVPQQASLRFSRKFILCRIFWPLSRPVPKGISHYDDISKFERPLPRRRLLSLQGIQAPIMLMVPSTGNGHPLWKGPSRLLSLL